MINALSRIAEPASFNRNRAAMPHVNGEPMQKIYAQWCPENQDEDKIKMAEVHNLWPRIYFRS